MSKKTDYKKFSNKLIELYDYATEKLIKQNEKSIENGEAKYHCADGRKCAAGFLISENFYNPAIEAPSENSEYLEDVVKAICRTNSLKIESDFNRECLEFLVMQLIDFHDRIKVKDWRKQQKIFREFLYARFLPEE